MDTLSAASPCSGSKRFLLVAAVFFPATLQAQLTTGAVEGTLRSTDGRRLADRSILIRGGTGFRIVIRTGAGGEYSVTLPYGRYRFSGEVRQDTSSEATTFLAPFRTTWLDLVMDASGAIRGAQPPADTARGRLYPESFSLPALLLNRETSSVTEPLDFTDIAGNRLAVESQRGFSWTDTQYKLHGMDATDSYQPGRPAVVPDVQALDEVVVRSGFAQTTLSGDGTEIGLFLAEPGLSWHGGLSTAYTGGALSWTNLPPPAGRGSVRQAAQYHWFTRDRVEIGGPLTRRADFYASATGQWSSQTEPLAAPGSDQHSRLLFGNARGRVMAGERDQFDALFSGAQVTLSDGGIPAGLEALTSDRMAPSFVLPGGFPGEREENHLDFLQAGWTHFLPRGLGIVQVRYGYSVAHRDTTTVPTGQSRIELLGGTVTGAPPLANMAARPLHGIEAAWQPAVLPAGSTRHQIVAGGGWKSSAPRNRFTAPSNMNLITANGAPAFVVEFNTPLDSREHVRSLSGYFADHMSLAPSLSLDGGVLADFSRGSLPAHPDLIAWNSVSPRAGFAWQVPHSHGLILRGTYLRLYTPLAGRYLDFGNPDSLGGSAYQWLASDADSQFQPDQKGTLLRRFGGPYSSISPALHRPHADEFDVGAEFPVTRRTVASIHLFRRDDKGRVAAVNTGVPASAYTPVSILDPGPDGIPSTFDDQRLTVYAQNPALFGQDRYLLTNPPGLRMLNTGLLAEAGAQAGQLTFHASFVAEKSYGPTNPGNAVYENDSGVIGALFLDPNTEIHAAGRSFVERAYVGKVQASYRLPPSWGGIEVAGIAGYTDGLVFARRLLVTDLPQGPFLVATTVRGSPEGGNRAQYVVNWNLRLGRQFRFPVGRFSVWADILNVTNAGQRLQESDLSGPSFNLRLPVAIQPPRALRLGFRSEF